MGESDSKSGSAGRTKESRRETPSGHADDPTHLSRRSLMRAGRSGIVKEPERKEKNVGMEAARAFFGGYQVISYQLSVRVLSV